MEFRILGPLEVRDGDRLFELRFIERVERSGFIDKLNREQPMAKDKYIPMVNTLVCLTCGAEQFFHSDVPSSLKCQTCGSTVFRTFSTPTKPDEVTESQLEETARSAARIRSAKSCNAGEHRSR